LKKLCNSPMLLRAAGDRNADEEELEGDDSLAQCLQPVLTGVPDGT
jgi:hypothetical protein